jgi:hypothetical protein
MRILRWAVLLACLPSPAWPQTTGALRGQVTDARGTPLPGVTIVLGSVSQGVRDRGGVTDAAGLFHVPGLPPARDYSVRASFPGLATITLHEVEVAPGRVAALRLVLQPESELRERVEVRARPRAVSLESPATETRLSAEFLEALPILGRNYQDALVLAPGVSDIDGDGSPNIHGARDTDMVTLVDGISTTDPLTGKIGAQLNIESIQEIEVKTLGATAEFGRAQGGFANIVTKSGGNEFGGAFKFFWRGSRLDGDGAGIDDARLHGGVGERGLRDLSFNDYLPFLSLEGPIVRDRAWFFLASESIRREEPVNAVNAAFVRGQRELRQFAKATWQIGANHRLAFSVNYDPQEYLNEGLNSFTREESGYRLRQGGTLLSLKGTSVLSPLVALETSVATFDQRPSLEPNLGPDTNGNGVLWVDRNRNRFMEARERDPGEDYDADGAFDVFEDKNRNFRLDPGEDLDGDGRLTSWVRIGDGGGCEGALREDIDCDGRLDAVDEDANGDGVWDQLTEDTDRDRRYDRGGEDRNGNGLLDDTPFPTGEYPYGTVRPVAPDREYTIDRNLGVRNGPYFEDLSDRRRRFTFRQDLSAFLGREGGSHDARVGVVVEREAIDRSTGRRGIVSPLRRECDGVTCIPPPAPAPTPPPVTFVNAILPSETTAENRATSLAAGVFVQDLWKPRPGLAVGLGLRLDREKADSFGYSFFDPVSEAAPFLRLLTLGGAVPDDRTGILRDPLFLDSGDIRGAAGFLTNTIRIGALRRLTRHHAAVSFDSEQLRSLGLLPEGEVDPAQLAARGVVPQQPEELTLTNHNLAPRMSLSWDPGRDGRTKLFATWGRYYDKLFLGTIVGEAGPDDVNRYYLLDEDGLGPGFVPSHQIGRLISKAPPSVTQVDRALQTPFSDELTLGFEREIAPEVTLAVTYVNRRFRQQLQDVDVNHNLRFDAGGTPLDQFGQLIINATTGSLETATFMPAADGRPDLYVHNVFFNQVLRIGNFNEARYKALQVSLTRRLARRWQMQGSYTYSRAVGSAEDFQSRLGNDPSTIESEFGYLDYDQRHVVKLNAATYLPKDWRLGASLTWGSGLPYSVISRFFALDNLGYDQFRTRFGFTADEPGSGFRFVPLRRNSERNRSTLDVNLHVRKHLVVGRTVGALSLEVFNLLNADDLRIFTYEPSPAGQAGRLVETSGGPRGAVQVDGERRFGRRFQVGFQIEF